MLEGAPLLIANLSAVGILAVLVFMLLTGQGIATRREVDAAEKRADTWQTAWDTERARNDVAFEQLGELLENSRATAKVMDALYDRANGGDSA